MKYQRIEDMRIDQDLTIKEISALLECNLSLIHISEPTRRS